jgi:hypothetical protein
MSSLTIPISDSLEAALDQRMKAAGFGSREQFVLFLLEAECSGDELEKVLGDRSEGPFELLEPDWKEKVRAAAQARM